MDEEIFNKVDFSIVFKNGRMLNPEFRKIAEQNQLKAPKDIHRNLNQANERNARVKTRIENMLSANRVSWNERDVEQWNFMRDFVLRHPTISKEELAEAIKEHYSIKDFYLEAMEGETIDHYLYIDDENEAKQILYDYSSKKRIGAVKIDEYGTRLTGLVRIPAVKKAFQEKNYALSFKSNDSMILPVVYQNIYKGAVGEVAGRAILEDKGIELAEIIDTTKFEKFDYCLANNKDVYIDFKNWSEYSQEKRDEYRQKCLSKLEKIGGRRVFIINVVADDFYIHKSYGGKIIEISTLCKRKGNFLFEVDPKDMNRVIGLLTEINYDDNM